MTDRPPPVPEHHEFDSMCADLEEYERLPAATRESPIDPDELSASFDEEILARLISP
jgi:hypothetical protein